MRFGKKMKDVAQERLLSCTMKIFALKKARYLETRWQTHGRKKKSMKLSPLRCKRGITEYSFVVRHSFSLLSVATIASVSLGRDSGHNNLYDRRKPFSYAYWRRGRSLVRSSLLEMFDASAGFHVVHPYPFRYGLLIFTIYRGNDYVSFTWNVGTLGKGKQSVFTRCHRLVTRKLATDQRQRACSFSINR